MAEPTFTGLTNSPPRSKKQSSEKFQYSQFQGQQSNYNSKILRGQLSPIQESSLNRITMNDSLNDRSLSIIRDSQSPEKRSIQLIVGTTQKMTKNDKPPQIIPLCIEERMEKITEFLLATCPEQLKFKVTKIHDGLRIFQKAESTEAIYFGTSKKGKSQKPFTFYVDFNLNMEKEFVIELLNSTHKYNQWMLFTRNQETLTSINRDTDILKLDAFMEIYSIISIKSQIKMLRSNFHEEKSKSQAMVFQLVKKGCKDIQSLNITIGISRVLDRTAMKVQIEVEPKPGNFYNQLAHNLGLEFAKSFCAFKTFAKQMNIIQNQLFKFQPFNDEKLKESMKETKPKQVSQNQMGRQEQNYQVSQNEVMQGQQQIPSQISFGREQFSKMYNNQQQKIDQQIYSQDHYAEQQQIQHYSPQRKTVSNIQVEEEKHQQDQIQQQDQNQTLQEIAIPPKGPSITGYLRENPEYCAPEDCKFNGEWTKWCIERCTEPQKEAYYKLRAKVDAVGLEYLSLNHVLRYVKSFNWSVDEAYDRLVTTEKWRVDMGFHDIDPSDIQKEIGMKIAFIYGHDRAGRTLLYFKGNRYNPAQTDLKNIQKFMTYVLDRVCVKMKKNADQFIMIFDLNSVGYSNFDLKQISKIAPILSNNYAERLGGMFFIRSGFLFNAMYTGVKPFIHEVTKAKFKFPGKNYYQEMIKNIDPENIPQEYGGTGPNLDDLENPI